MKELYSNIINYKFSWLLASFGALEYKSLLPYLGQILLLLSAHLLTFVFEFLKNKYFNKKTRDSYDQRMDKYIDSFKDPTKFR